MSKFQESLASDKFLVTVEANPPRGTHLDAFLSTLKGWTNRVDAVNLPDGRSARIHLGPMAGCLLAKEKGLEPILTLSCRDRNRLAMTSDLLGAYALGIQNILCVSGDYFHFGHAEDAKPVYDLDSVQAIRMIRQMEEGRDIGGNELAGKPSFCVGCVGNPQSSPLEPHLLKLDKKLKAGAAFVQTLNIFDLNKSRSFFEHLKGKNVKLLAGIRLITRREVMLAETGKLPGNPIPEDIEKEIRGLENPDHIIENARNRMIAMIKEVKNAGLCHGVHLTADGHDDLIPEIIREAGI
jgi:5,10-methylenetetrahydrofolate reductase